MKKLALTLAIVLGLGMSSFAGNDGYTEQGGLFGRGAEISNTGDRAGGFPGLPGHGETDDQDAEAPLGSGIAVLLGLGAAYAFAKKREE